MNTMILIPALVLILGMLAYALSANPKVQELGRLAFLCGLLVTLWTVASHAIKL